MAPVASFILPLNFSDIRVAYLGLPSRLAVHVYES
jgi:hypothetical protein